MKSAAILAAAALCAVAASCASADEQPASTPGKLTFYPSAASKLAGGPLEDRMEVNEKFLLETVPPSSRAEGLLFLHGLESNPGSFLQTEEEAGLP